MVAATYAKDLLCRIVPGQVKKEERILDILKPTIEHIARTIDRINHDLILNKLHVATDAGFNTFDDRDEVEYLQGTKIDLLQQVMEWAIAPSQKIIF
ncbi:unnamed protein product [Penicillium salamii]|uniref:Uncharacterized protein n=1 Tax=Penicillium salamii TaxID=1612424 RepID=A0A9W4N258_9EURO|nr:unnamed protein product [Penicillium salamii]